MREILFKGKTVYTNSWIYGNLINYNDDIYILTTPVSENIFNGHQVIPETIGQYTNMEDMNDVNIFEGDKVMLTDSSGDVKVFKVVMHEGRWVIMRNDTIYNDLYEVREICKVVEQ